MGAARWEPVARAAGLWAAVATVAVAMEVRAARVASRAGPDTPVRRAGAREEAAAGAATWAVVATAWVASVPARAVVVMGAVAGARASAEAATAVEALVRVAAVMGA
eukprot:5333030-Prymnesium_polylepis.1